MPLSGALFWLLASVLLDSDLMLLGFCSVAAHCCGFKKCIRRCQFCRFSSAFNLVRSVHRQSDCRSSLKSRVVGSEAGAIRLCQSRARFCAAHTSIAAVRDTNHSTGTGLGHSAWHRTGEGLVRLAMLGWGMVLKIML